MARNKDPLGGLLDDGKTYIRSKGPSRSRRSPMIYTQSPPHFTSLTEQQKKVRKAGRFCGRVVKGIRDTDRRRMAMGECVTSFWDNDMFEMDMDELLDDDTISRMRARVS